MTRYFAEADRVVLPAFVRGTTDRLAYPRPNTPLACVRAPKTRDFQTSHPDPDILWSAKFPVLEGTYHVVPAIGYQHLAMGTDINLPGEHPSLRPYQQVNTPPPRATREYLENAWGAGVAVLTLQRVRPVLLLGQLGDVQPDVIETGYGHFVLTPGWWLACELTGRGTRLLDPIYLREEFDRISGPQLAL